MKLPAGLDTHANGGRDAGDRAPFALRADVRELRDEDFLPVVRRSKSRSFLEHDDRVALDR
jgi:hypothetical protein